jgi:hypothetical protein
MDRLDHLLAKPRATLTEDERLELHCLLFDLPDYDDEHFLRACGVRPPDLRDDLAGPRPLRQTHAS